MRRIVVGFDGSEHARRALERAVELAGPETRLAVVSAVHVEPFLGGGVSPIDPVEAEDRDKALAEARSILGSRGVEADFIEGTGGPADVLVEEAKESGADLIVVGSRGLNFAQRALLGSVSTDVVHHAPCDVLVVR